MAAQKAEWAALGGGSCIGEFAALVGLEQFNVRSREADRGRGTAKHLASQSLGDGRVLE